MLFDEISNLIKKEKMGEESLFTPSYPSGIDIMDYRNGYMDDDGINIGFDGGKLITVIGKSGSGKTSLAIQMACSIVEDYEEGSIIHYDFERATNLARVKAISGWDKETLKKKYKNLKNNIYSESIYQIVKAIDQLKNEPSTYEKIKIDTGEVDDEGEPIYTLPPTVILLDSWAMMIPKDISEEEKLSGQMSATSIARQNNAVIKRILGPMVRGNITLIVINHITTKIEISAFSKTQAAINYLKQDESIPGGSSCLYLSNNIIRVTTSTKLEEDSTYGVKGFMVVGEFIKSRSNEAGRKFEMIFEQSIGFNNVLTNLHNLKEMGYLKGSPRAYFFEALPDVKFTLKTFMEKYNENEELQEVMAELVDEAYSKLIPNTGINELDEDEESIELIECVDEDNDIWKGSDGNYYDSEGNEVDYKPKKKKIKK